MLGLGAAATGALAAPLRALAQAQDLPVTGRALPGLEALDAVVLPILAAHAIPGGAVAIAYQGKLKLARGYGYADVGARTPMRPGTFVALASVSKVLTAQTVLKLVGQGRLALGDRAFGFFPDLKPPPGMREDPRLSEITVEMCLHHTGGWDRRVSGDPSGWGPRITRALNLQGPPPPLAMIRYMKGVPLDFDPGTKQAYSNFGFVLLGGIIAKVTGMPYPDAVRRLFLDPIGATGLRLDDEPPRYQPGEAKRYVEGNATPVPGGNPRMVMASGGWQATAVGMTQVLTAIDGSRTGSPFLAPAQYDAMLQPAPGIARPSPDHWMGLGWDLVQTFPDSAQPGKVRASYGKDGGIGGIETYVEHLAIGVDYVLLFNSRPRGTGMPGPLELVKPKVIEFARGVRDWPEGDLFGAGV
ncbi:MAG: serine hydrolase domain-containing protein [Burkholderiales bacterium]